jgi:hypothetical protein
VRYAGCCGCRCRCCRGGGGLLTPGGIPGQGPVAQRIGALAREIDGVPGVSPDIAGISPDIAGKIPAMSGETPAVSGEIPAMSGETPAMSGGTPAVSGGTPAVSGGTPALIIRLPDEPKKWGGGGSATCGQIKHFRNFFRRISRRNVHARGSRPGGGSGDAVVRGGGGHGEGAGLVWSDIQRPLYLFPGKRASEKIPTGKYLIRMPSGRARFRGDGGGGVQTDVTRIVPQDGPLRRAGDDFPTFRLSTLD